MKRSPRLALIVCRLTAAGCAALMVLSCGLANAQQDAAAGGDQDAGSRFQPEEVDLSAFEGVERGDSIGRTETQGFGVVAESAGGANGAGPGGGGGGGGGFGGLGGLGGLFGGLGGAFGGQNATSSKPKIRVRLKSAINVPPREPAEIQQSAMSTLRSAPPRSGVRGVNVIMDGRTAILRGTVTSEKDRRMSELLMRLEPGVSDVQNQVVVAAE